MEDPCERGRRRKEKRSAHDDVVKTTGKLGDDRDALLPSQLTMVVETLQPGEPLVGTSPPFRVVAEREVDDRRGLRSGRSEGEERLDLVEDLTEVIVEVAV